MILYDLRNIIQTALVYDQRKELVPFRFWPLQDKFYDWLQMYRFILALKSRQSGFSTITGIHALMQCAWQRDFTALVLSVSESDAKEFLKRAWSLYKTLAPELRRISPTERTPMHEIEFKNGSRLLCLSAQKGSGYTADLVIIDEFFKICTKASKITITEVLRAVVPTIDRRKGQLVLVGTAEGYNQQRRMYLDAKAKKSRYHAFFFSCFDDPTMTPQKRLEMASTYNDKRSIDQEYPITDRDAFLSSGNARFDTKCVEQLEKTILSLAFRGNIDDSDIVSSNEDGPIRFFHRYSSRMQYVITADTAEGHGGDYNCAKVFERNTCIQVAEFHSNMTEAGEFGCVLVRLARHYNNALLVVERNNHGITVLYAVISVMQYPPQLVFRGRPGGKENEAQAVTDPNPRYGFVTSTITKALIINRLAKLISELDPELSLSTEDIDELYSFIRNQDGSAGADEGENDDRVIALAIFYFVHQFLDEQTFWPHEKCENCTFFHEDKQACEMSKRVINSELKKESVCAMFLIHPDYTGDENIA